MQRIATVDDVDVNNKLIAGYLRSIPNSEVSTFTDPLKAIAWCHEYVPDIILVDFMMPEMNGLDFIRNVRACDRLRDTPVIMVTSDGKRDTLYEVLKLGGTDFLQKPVDGLELIARTRNLLELRTRQRELKIANQQLLRLATTDPLTGLRNRRFFLGEVRREVEEPDARSKGCCLAVLDIDHFKSINDNHGHDGGDEVLRCLARLLANSVRNIDAVGRLGGEEFGILFPGTNLPEAEVICERILNKLRKTAITIGSQQVIVTSSLGLAELQRGAEDEKSWIKRADHALFAAKAKGRDRLEKSEPEIIDAAVPHRRKPSHHPGPADTDALHALQADLAAASFEI